MNDSQMNIEFLYRAMMDGFKRLEEEMKDLRIELREEIKYIRELINEDRKKLDKIIDDRDKIQFRLTRGWAFATFSISFFSVIVALIIQQAL